MLNGPGSQAQDSRLQARPVAMAKKTADTPEGADARLLCLDVSLTRLGAFLKTKVSGGGRGTSNGGFLSHFGESGTLSGSDRI